MINTAKIQYYLIDKDTGKKWDFQPENHDGQLQNVGGIGFSDDYTSGRLDNFFILTNKEAQQKEITGEIVFLSTKKEQEFKSFTNRKNLSLQRVLPDKTEYYIDVVVSAFSITDSSRFVIEKYMCDVSFLVKTPWYKTKQVYTYSPGDDPGKTYSYTYPYTYKASPYYSIVNTSSIDAICNLQIYGSVQDPSWYIANQGDDVLTMRGHYNGTIPDNNYLLVDSTPTNPGVWLCDAATGEKLSDEYNNCDLRYDTFIFLPTGNNTINVNAGDNPVRSRIEVNIFEQYP